MQVLLDKGVQEGKILFLSLIAAPEGVHKICGQYPKVKVITTEIDEGIAPDFQVIPGADLMTLAHLGRLYTGVLKLTAACNSIIARGCVCSAGVGEFGDRYFCD